MVWDGIRGGVWEGLDSEHILKLELMRFVDGLSVREIINQRFLTCATKRMAIPITKTENTALGADCRGNNQKNQHGITDS